MAGFGHSAFEGGRIPCPHCGSTDCCGIDWKGSAEASHLICCYTNKRVTDAQLVASAEAHGFKRKPPAKRRYTKKVPN